MKQLIAGVILILILGIGGFLYRNVLEHTNPAAVATSTAQTNGTACPADAKMCPDGTSVGRTGTSCTFAACALPNVEIKDARIAFAIPAGYTADENAIGADTTLLAAFIKPAAQPNSFQTIVIRDYPIESGQTATSTMLAKTMYESSGNQPKSLSEFTKVIVNGKTYYRVVLERFEGQIHTAYYLPRAADVLRFEVLERDVTNWTDAKLDIETLPAHKALHQLLSGLQLQ